LPQKFGQALCFIFLKKFYRAQRFASKALKRVYICISLFFSSKKEFFISTLERATVAQESHPVNTK